MTAALIPAGFTVIAFTPTLNWILLSHTTMVREIYYSQAIRFK